MAPAIERYEASARPQGGDRPSHKIAAHTDLILSLVDEARHQTLFELVEQLATRGVLT